MKSLKTYLENATPANTIGMGNPDTGEAAISVKHRTKKNLKSKAIKNACKKNKEEE